jgi:hypothetical protein
MNEEDSEQFIAGRETWKKCAVVMDENVPREGDDITDWVHGFFYQMIAGLVFVRGVEDASALLNGTLQAVAEDESNMTRQ